MFSVHRGPEPSTGPGCVFFFTTETVTQGLDLNSGAGCVRKNRKTARFHELWIQGWRGFETASIIVDAF